MLTPWTAIAPGASSAGVKAYQKEGVRLAFNREYGRDESPHRITSWIGAYAEYRGWNVDTRYGAQKDQYKFIRSTDV